MILKPGTKLTVRRDLEKESFHDYSKVAGGQVYLANPMFQMAGKRVTVRYVQENGLIRIEESTGWKWTPDMFEELKTPEAAHLNGYMTYEQMKEAES